MPPREHGRPYTAVKDAVGRDPASFVVDAFVIKTPTNCERLPARERYDIEMTSHIGSELRAGNASAKNNRRYWTDSKCGFVNCMAIRLLGFFFRHMWWCASILRRLHGPETRVHVIRPRSLLKTFAEIGLTTEVVRRPHCGATRLHAPQNELRSLQGSCLWSPGERE